MPTVDCRLSTVDFRFCEQTQVYYRTQQTERGEIEQYEIIPLRVFMERSIKETVSLFDVGMVADASPLPLYYQLIKLLEDKIRSNQWKAGWLLPSEQVFCEYFGL